MAGGFACATLLLFFCLLHHSLSFCFRRSDFEPGWGEVFERVYNYTILLAGCGLSFNER